MLKICTVCEICSDRICLRRIAFSDLLLNHSQSAPFERIDKNSFINTNDSADMEVHFVQNIIK